MSNKTIYIINIQTYFNVIPEKTQSSHWELHIFPPFIKINLFLKNIG